MVKNSNVGLKLIDIIKVINCSRKVNQSHLFYPDALGSFSVIAEKYILFHQMCTKKRKRRYKWKDVVEIPVDVKNVNHCMS